jgi:hypothetical protein
MMMMDFSVCVPMVYKTRVGARADTRLLAGYLVEGDVDPTRALG